MVFPDFDKKDNSSSLGNHSRLRSILALILFSVGVTSILYGFKKGSCPAPLEENPEVKLDMVTLDSEDDDEELIIVDVAGAVKEPGVYSLSQHSRLSEAIELAGGFAKEVDKLWVAKSLNLAKTLIDEEKVYIPFESEEVETNFSEMTNFNKGQTSQKLVNLNTATQPELESLPGIGPVRAQAIMQARPFASINELLEKKIIGEAVFYQMKDKVTVGE
jgi:competence protein ComEA